MKALIARLAATTLKVRVTTGVVVALLALNLVLFFWWNNEPELFDVRADALARVGGDEARLWPGVVTTHTLIRTVDALLNKSGGYLSNDVVPPSIFMDNIPNWEFGVVNQIRDLAKSLRNDMSRSRTQSTEDPALQIAEPHFNYQNDAWILPSTESEFGAGRNQLDLYLTRLLDANNQSAQFYARADNLSDYLDLVEKRLGSLSQRLSASIAQERVNVDIGGAVAAQSTTDERASISVKTPWLEIDDVFYEARGSAWALILFLRAVEIDFAPVLRDKNAVAHMQQVIRELEGTQAAIWSPMILNGSGFGFVANHSLSMASYLSRANAAVRDLRQLLEQG